MIEVREVEESDLPTESGNKLLGTSVIVYGVLNHRTSIPATVARLASSPDRHLHVQELQMKMKKKSEDWIASAAECAENEETEDGSS